VRVESYQRQKLLKPTGSGHGNQMHGNPVSCMLRSGDFNCPQKNPELNWIGLKESAWITKVEIAWLVPNTIDKTVRMLADQPFPTWSLHSTV
jgi:hypothetical protein